MLTYDRRRVVDKLNALTYKPYKQNSVKKKTNYGIWVFWIIILILVVIFL